MPIVLMPSTLKPPTLRTSDCLQPPLMPYPAAPVDSGYGITYLSSFYMEKSLSFTHEFMN